MKLTSPFPAKPTATNPSEIWVESPALWTDGGRRPLPDLSTKSPRGGRKVNGPEIPPLRCGNLQSNVTQPGRIIAATPVGGSRRKTPIVAGAADRATDPAEEVTTPAARASDDLHCSSVERPRK